MKLSYVPGDLHLRKDEEGFLCVVLKGELIRRLRSQKEAVRLFNQIRSDLEKSRPPAKESAEEKRELLLRAIGDTLTRHNSLRNADPKKRTGTRTFG